MRWIVDGMNVIGSRPDGWWRDREAAMRRLVEQLERWAVGQGGDEVAVVFEKPPSAPIAAHGVDVSYAPRARPDSADDEIVRRVVADADPDSFRVVTSDRRLADRVLHAGALIEPAGSFRARLDATGGRTPAP